MRHASGARNQVLCGRIGADANSKTLTYTEIAFQLFFFEMAFETTIDFLSDLPESQLAKSDQVRGPEKVAESSLHAVCRIDIAAFHASLQCFRREVGHHNFGNALQHPVGNCLAHSDASNVLHAGREPLQMLNIHRGEH